MAPCLRDRHATGARKGAADWPMGVELDDNNRMVKGIHLQRNYPCYALTRTLHDSFAIA